VAISPCRWDQHRQKTRIGRVIDRLRCSIFQNGEVCQARPCSVSLVEVSGRGKFLCESREITVSKQNFSRLDV
jgi:hypothetical protein